MSLGEAMPQFAGESGQLNTGCISVVSFSLFFSPGYSWEVVEALEDLGIPVEAIGLDLHDHGASQDALVVLLCGGRIIEYLGLVLADVNPDTPVFLLPPSKMEALSVATNIVLRAFVSPYYSISLN